MDAQKNVYLQQVMDEKEEVERDLRVKRQRRTGSAGGSSNSTAENAAVDYRVTGFWRMKNVIVPPNAYIVHTRRGRKKPLHVGLGLSFRFDPVRDSFLVVPAAMQTIVVNANSICRERQGVLVQGYVQWIIADFETAYRKLDFSDPVDPMCIVNVQLREQAEAAIKDTVATMSIDDVLADKQPIIEELTARLRQVAEGGDDNEGLGLRIVTVQIKEAVVSSTRLWESLQTAFRAERAKEARLAELAAQSVIHSRETEEQQKTATLEIEKDAAINRRRAEAEATAFNQELEEKARRGRMEAEMLAEMATHETAKIKTASALEQLRISKQLAQEQLRLDARNRQINQEIEHETARRQVANQLSPERVQEHLIESLPEIVDKLPKPDQMSTISLAGLDLQATISSLIELLKPRSKP